jgi:hypothetical protein
MGPYALRRVPDAGQPYGMSIRQRLQENTFEHAENGRCGADFSCCLTNLRQVDWRRRGSPFAEDSEPSGSRNGSTEMRS